MTQFLNLVADSFFSVLIKKYSGGYLKELFMQ